MAKGDRVGVLLDVGEGKTERHDIVADKAGRTVEWKREDRRGVYEVEVFGRSGTPVRTVQFRLDRVVMIELVPA